jgi:hypothetical protein
MGDGRRRRGARARWWGAAPVLALVVLAGCGSSPAAIPSVTVVGDSGMALEQTAAAKALVPPFAPTYVVRYGDPVGVVSTFLRNAIRNRGNPEVAVTNLGTNEALRSRDQQGGGILDPLVQATSGIPCVVLTTVNVKVDGQAHGTAARINHEIKALVASDPTKYKVVDWNYFLATLPASSVSTYLQADDRLETPAGADWLATADRSGVLACGTKRQPTVIGPNTG